MPLAAPGIGSLPDDVLAQVLRHTDQPGRVACMLASKALASALRVPAAWQDGITLGELDHTAVSFVLARACPVVVIESARPDDVAWFLDSLADAGGDGILKNLTVRLGAIQRLPAALTEAVCRQRNLAAVRVDIRELKTTSEVFFAPETPLAALETLSIVEQTSAGTGTRQLVLWFGGMQSNLPALEAVELQLGMSDIMVSVDTMPSLRRLAYVCDEEAGGETYEDVNLVGANLDVLELEVGVHSDFRRLSHHLRQASVRKLVLHVNDEFLDLMLPLSPDMTELVLSMRLEATEVEFDFRTLPAWQPKLACITVVPAPDWSVDECEYTLSFRNCNALSDWTAFLASCTLVTPPCTRLHALPR